MSTEEKDVKKIWYRIGFDPKGTAHLDRAVELGNDSMLNNRVTNVTLAPLEDNGQINVYGLRTLQRDQNGWPNGYFPDVQLAKQAVMDTLDAQVARMNAAKATVEAVEVPESLKLAD